MELGSFYNLSSNHFSNVEAHACDNFDYQCIWFWNDFMLPLLILNKDSKMWTLPLFQYNYQGQYFNDYGPSLHLILWEL